MTSATKLHSTVSTPTITTSPSTFLVAEITKYLLTNYLTH